MCHILIVLFKKIKHHFECHFVLILSLPKCRKYFYVYICIYIHMFVCIHTYIYIFRRTCFNFFFFFKKGNVT